MESRDVVERAWNRLRLALLWARKRGVLRRKVVMELRVFPKYLKCLGEKTPPSQAHYYYERELSFDKTPIFNVKMYRRPSSTRFHIPCLMNPQVDFDDDNDHHDEDFEYDDDDTAGPKSNNNSNEEEEEIDERAEEFIAKFYQQLKMQRQISYLQYNES